MITDGSVRVRGAREHNLKNIDVDIPRDALVVSRRPFHQLTVPDVDEIDGLPPAVALPQQRGSPSTRSSVGVTTLSNLLRMLYSCAGDYPARQPLLYAESFSPNTPEGACPRCHGLGRAESARHPCRSHRGPRRSRRAAGRSTS